jgi:hypothetical protein
MRATRNRWLGFTVCLASAIGGCGNDNSNAPADMAVPIQYDLIPPQLCTPGAKECVANDVARVCSPDGYQWSAVECHDGEKCMNGDCAPDNSVCIKGDAFCMGNTAYRCPAGTGYTMTACPAKTACVGKGLCVGTCAIGATRCRTSIYQAGNVIVNLSDQHFPDALPSTTIETCTDGFTWSVTSTCMANTWCVDTTTDPNNQQAACKAGDCTPDPNFCIRGGGNVDLRPFVCGNKNNAAADPTKFKSSCVPTPDGYKWLATECDPGKVCTPGAITCQLSGNGDNTVRSEADCTSKCTPGRQVCGGLTLVASDGNHSVPLQYKTCGADGTYGALQNCNPDPTAVSFGCMQDPTNNSKIVCGDLACVQSIFPAGICTAGGQFLGCGTDRKLLPASQAAPCPNNQICTSVPGIDGVTPLRYGSQALGQCVSQCQPGDKRCVGSTVQSCINGAFVDDVLCAQDAGSGSVCFQYSTAVNSPTPNSAQGSDQFVTPRTGAICGGECIPGTHACATIGMPANNAIKTCNANGKYDPAVACTKGLCNFFNPDAACLLDCIPGSLYCRGAPVTVGGTQFSAKAAQGTCPDTGIRDMTDPCPSGAGCCTGDTYCRTNAGGVSLGCVQCVGEPNEKGVVDSRCTNKGGGVDGGLFQAVEQCGANNTWSAPVPCLPNTGCFESSTLGALCSGT